MSVTSGNYSPDKVGPPPPGTRGNPKVYRALITQTGVNAPVATVLENTLGGTPVWSYVGVGQYSATLVGAFPDQRTHLLNNSYVDFGNQVAVILAWGSANMVSIRTVDGGVNADGILQQNSIQILVYP